MGDRVLGYCFFHDRLETASMCSFAMSRPVLTISDCRLGMPSYTAPIRPLQVYRVMQPLGRGSYGVVRRVRHMRCLSSRLGLFCQLAGQGNQATSLNLSSICAYRLSTGCAAVPE